MKFEKIKDLDDLVTVKVTLTDKNDLICLESRAYLNFGLTGDGKLIENQGTSSASSRMQFFNGQAIISIQKNKGTSFVSAASEGLPTQFLEIK